MHKQWVNNWNFQFYAEMQSAFCKLCMLICPRLLEKTTSLRRSVTQPYKWTTDIQRRSQNLRHFYPGMGLKLGVVGFWRNQNSYDSLVAYVTCIYCGLSMKIIMHKVLHGARRSWTCLFLHVWSANTQRSPLSAPWLTTPLLGALCEVWDLPCLNLWSEQNN